MTLVDQSGRKAWGGAGGWGLGEFGKGGRSETQRAHLSLAFQLELISSKFITLNCIVLDVSERFRCRRGV